MLMGQRGLNMSTTNEVCPVRRAIEFYEDRNGALMLLYWRDNAEQQAMLWSEFVELPEFQDIINKVYIYIQAHYEFLLEKHREQRNLHESEIEWRVRRFISKHMAGKDLSEWNWIERTDGTYECNIEALSCATGCPAILAIREQVNKAQLDPMFEADQHGESHQMGKEFS